MQKSVADNRNAPSRVSSVRDGPSVSQTYLLLSRVPGQVEMAAGGGRSASRKNRKLIVEAGTGTGKTLAYLVPALLVRAACRDLHRHESAAGTAVLPRYPIPRKCARAGLCAVCVHERPQQLRLPRRRSTTPKRTPDPRAGWKKSAEFRIIQRLGKDHRDR